LIGTFRQRWASILDESAQPDVSLQVTKEEFKQSTMKEATSFIDDVVKFAETPMN
jgi:hypothetical protein